MRLIRIIADIFITIIAFCIIFPILLDMNLIGTAGPYKERAIALLFSSENIMATVFGFIITAALVLAIRWVILKRIEKNQNE